MLFELLLLYIYNKNNIHYMEVKKEDIEVLKNTRVNQLQRMLLDEKR
jgi:hypothetical protein